MFHVLLKILLFFITLTFASSPEILTPHGPRKRDHVKKDTLKSITPTVEGNGNLLEPTKATGG